MGTTVGRSIAHAGLWWPRIPRVRQASPQARGLVCWFPLSPCTGNVAPEIVAGRNGHVVNVDNQLGELAWNSDAHFGRVPYFDGAREIRFSDRGMPSGTASRTIGVWVKFTELPPIVAGAVNYGSPTETHGVILGTGNTMDWQPPGCLGMTQWGKAVVTPRAYHDGAWHHLVTVFDGSAWSVYVDGEWETSKGIAELPTDTWLSGVARIGGIDFGSPYLYWKGSLRDVRIYDRALSATEIRALYDRATRFDLWAPRRRWLARPAPPPPLLRGAAQIYVAGQESGQCQLAGAEAGEAT